MVEDAVPTRGLANLTRRHGPDHVAEDEAWRRRRAEAFRLLDEARLLRAYKLATLVLRDRDQAEDAAQEAIERAWQSWGTLREPDRFDAWFDRILVNVCRNRLRRAKVIRFVELDAAIDLPTVDRSSEVAERLALERAFGRLTPDQRVAVVLRVYFDLTIDQIAERLGIPSGTVKSRLHYALNALRQEVER